MKHIIASKGSIIGTDTGEELLVLGSNIEGETRRYTCVRITEHYSYAKPSVEIMCGHVLYTDINTIDDYCIEEVIDTATEHDTDIVDEAIRSYLLISEESRSVDGSLFLENTSLIEENKRLKSRIETLTDENNELKSHISELSGVIDPEEVEERHIVDLKTEISVLNRIIDTLLDRIGCSNGKEQ